MSPELSNPSCRLSFFFKTSVMALCFIFLLQFLTGIAVRRALERRLQLQFSGHFMPVPFFPIFFSTDASFFWKNRVTLLSGSVKINYNVIPLITKNSIRIHVQGKDMHARLSGDWAKIQGVEEVRIDSLDANVEVGKNGLGEVFWVNIDSPSFQFHIQNNEA